MKRSFILTVIFLISITILLRIGNADSLDKQTKQVSETKKEVKNEKHILFLNKFFKYYMNNDISSMKSTIASHADIVMSLIEDYFDVAETIAGSDYIVDFQAEWSHGRALDFSRLTHMIVTIGYFYDKEISGKTLKYLNTRLEKIIVIAINAAEAARNSGSYGKAIYKYEGIAWLARSLEISLIDEGAYNALSELYNQIGNSKKSIEYKEKSKLLSDIRK